MKYKLVAADFDGTLHDSDIPSISNENKQAVRDYIRAGGKFIISTGRMYSSIRPHAVELGLKGEIIAYQGAAIYDIESNELLVHIPIEVDEAVEILRFVESYGIHCQIYYNDVYYSYSENEFTDTYSKYCGIPLNLTDMPLSEYCHKNNFSPTKLMVIASKDIMSEFYNRTVEKYHGKYGFARSSEKFFEITSIKANKGVALDYLSKLYGIDKSEILAIGDSTNDIAMIRYAGLGVAVANAMDELKREADYITDYAANNAVAKILYDIIEEKL